MKVKMITAIVALFFSGAALVACAGSMVDELAPQSESEPTEPGTSEEIIFEDVTFEDGEQPYVEKVREALSGGWWYGEGGAGFTFYTDGTASQQFAGESPEDPGSLNGTYTITKQSENVYLITFEITDDMSRHVQVYNVSETSTLRYNYADDTLVNLQGEWTMIRHGEFLPHDPPHDPPRADVLTYSTVNTDAGIEYRFEILGFALTLPHSWSGMYEVGGDDIGHFGDGDNGFVTVDFRVTDISMRLFWIQRYDAEVWDIDDWEVIRTINVGDVEYMMVIHSWQRSAMREHDWIGDYRDTVEIMLHETDTIVADSVRGL